LLIAFGPPEIPRLHEVTLDWRVLACAFTASLLCNAFFGLAPAAGLLSNNLATALRAGGRGGSESWLSAKLRSSFLVAEIALALVLVVASGLLVRTFFRLLAVDPGVHAERVLTFELSLPGRKYQDANQIVAFYNKALQGLRAMPGVAYAGIVETIPLTGSSDSTVIRLPDRPAIAGKEPYANYNIASPGYFDAVGTTLLSGRSFLDSDVESSMPVVIVNATMAKKFWPGMDPIGRKVGLGDPNYPVMQVVGVVADVKHLSLREEAGPEIYVPFTQKPFPSMLVMHAVIRSRMDAVSLAGAARDAIRQRDAEVPVANVATLSAIVAESFAGQRFSMLLMGGFGAISLTLASIGLYGVISYAVLQRTREIGIRIALGATRGMVAAMVVGQGARLIGAGILAGTVVAISVTRLLASLLFGVPPNDWLTFGVVVPLLTGVALAACYAPALRASRVEPVTALRHE
jgi:putative ABC transport system permease protein